MEQINNTHNLIFEKWAADLAKKDRSKKNVRINFEELFSALKRSGATFQIAKSLLPLAIKAHCPNTIVKKNIWKKLKNNLDCTEQEFYDSWITGIKNAATEVFFEEYPIKVDDDNDGLPKKYGSMSEREYKLQRRHADSFPTLNTDLLELEYKKRSNDLDLEDILGGMYDDK
jgi:hypothetical protein